MYNTKEYAECTDWAKISYGLSKKTIEFEDEFKSKILYLHAQCLLDWNEIRHWKEASDLIDEAYSLFPINIGVSLKIKSLLAGKIDDSTVKNYISNQLQIFLSETTDMPIINEQLYDNNENVYDNNDRYETIYNIIKDLVSFERMELGVYVCDHALQIFRNINQIGEILLLKINIHLKFKQEYKAMKLLNSFLLECCQSKCFSPHVLKNFKVLIWNQASQHYENEWYEKSLEYYNLALKFDASTGGCSKQESSGTHRNICQCYLQMHKYKEGWEVICNVAKDFENYDIKKDMMPVTKDNIILDDTIKDNLSLKTCYLLCKAGVFLEREDVVCHCLLKMVACKNDNIDDFNVFLCGITQLAFEMCGEKVIKQALRVLVDNCTEDICIIQGAKCLIRLYLTDNMIADNEMKNVISLLDKCYDKLAEMLLNNQRSVETNKKEENVLEILKELNQSADWFSTICWNLAADSTSNQGCEYDFFEYSFKFSALLSHDEILTSKPEYKVRQIKSLLFSSLFKKRLYESVPVKKDSISSVEESNFDLNDEISEHEAMYVDQEVESDRNRGKENLLSSSLSYLSILKTIFMAEDELLYRENEEMLQIRITALLCEFELKSKLNIPECENTFNQIMDLLKDAKLYDIEFMELLFSLILHYHPFAQTMLVECFNQAIITIKRTKPLDYQKIIDFYSKIIYCNFQHLNITSHTVYKDDKKKLFEYYEEVLNILEHNNIRKSAENLYADCDATYDKDELIMSNPSGQKLNKEINNLVDNEIEVLRWLMTKAWNLGINYANLSRSCKGCLIWQDGDEKEITVEQDKQSKLNDKKEMDNLAIKWCSMALLFLPYVTIVESQNDETKMMVSIVDHKWKNLGDKIIDEDREEMIGFDEDKFMRSDNLSNISIHVEIANNSQLEVKWAYIGILGPSHWPMLYPYCAGFKQSPIDIVSENTFYDINLVDFKTRKMLDDVDQTLTMENTGKTAKISITGERPLISEGDLPDIYQGWQFHFHWGERNKDGSEHTIDHRRYPMEMHFIFLKIQYENMSDALKDPTGLAIFSTFFDIGDYNIELAPLVNCLEFITYEGDKIKIPSFPLRTLLPVNTRDYYRYLGSLPVPECNEVAIWTVFSNTLKLSQEQMDAFRRLKARPKFSPYQHDVSNNVRPQQGIYDRMITTSHRRHIRFPKKKEDFLDQNLAKDLVYDEEILPSEINKEIEKEMFDDKFGKF
ncbi:unnamed protein product [Gordionus sp. m RMFG-2023]